MPAQSFTPHVDPDDLALQDLSVTVSKPLENQDRRRGGDEHHGARDGRLAARQQSERARSGRAAGAGGGRSYAFRRS